MARARTLWMVALVVPPCWGVAQTAYAAIDTMRLDDMRPHVLRTHDNGKTWAEIVNGIPAGGIARVVRDFKAALQRPEVSSVLVPPERRDLLELDLTELTYG